MSTTTITLTVTPNIIDPLDGAKVSHDSPHKLTVTIESNNGYIQTIEVPAGTTVVWHPPAGWTSATFTAPGADEVNRVIS